MYAFDRAVDARMDAASTAVRTSDSAPVSADVTLDGAWNVDGVILNGGYLQAVVTNAARTVLGSRRDPVVVSTSFVGRAAPGPARVAVRLLHRGRRIDKVAAALVQDDTVVVESLVTFGDLPTAGSGAAPPDPGIPSPLGQVPDPDRCIRPQPDGSALGRAGLLGVLDYAFVPEASGWLRGSFGEPRIRMWVRFADHRPVDGLALVALADMAPPVSFAAGRFGWAPTLQLQVGVLSLPEGDWSVGDWLLADLLGAPYDGPFGCESCDLWDRTGRLVARGRQVAIPPQG